MSAPRTYVPRTYVVAFSDVRRFQTAVVAGSEAEAIETAEELWDIDGVDGEHPFDLIGDCTFDQPEARIEDAPPPERDWSVAFHRAGVHKTAVRAHTEKEAIGIAQAMLFETDITLFDLVWCEDTEWQAQLIETNLIDGGASCR